MALFEKYLFIKKSKLPKAGKGLFTRIEIPKANELLNTRESFACGKDVKHLDGYNSYLMYITRNAVIDAQPAISTFGRYANDANGFGRTPGLKNNGEYVSEGNKCFIESLRTIRKERRS